MARNDAAALKAAIDCVSATQAPDSNAMVASEQKIIDCGTDAFRSQALLYTNMLVQAYQAANIRVQVSDVRAAVERHNSDGSVEVLVAMRIKSSTDQIAERNRLPPAGENGARRRPVQDFQARPGDEVTVVVEDIQTTAAVTEPSQDALAPWHLRVGAFAVDVFPAIAALTTLALVSFTVPARGAWWWSCLSAIGVVILVMLVNRLLLPTITGWSLGRALFGIAVVGRDGAAIGPWTLLLRDLAHLLDTVSVVGWLWPLWDSRRRTFADLLLRTEVRRVQRDEPLPNIRRWTAVAVLTAAAVCLAGAAVSYAAVYSRERATDETVAQIKAQGPKIVAQMLTYDPKTLRDDFAHAQSLATDKYRGQLKEQQDIVQKGTPVINEYWPMDWSVLSAAPDRATMLLFLQGRRGAAPGERYISATLRVNFVKGGDDRWRVDDLTVLTKPKPPGNGK